MPRPIALLLAAVLVAWPGPSRSAGIDAQRFAPAAGASGGFMVERADVAGHLEPAAGLFLHLADDPIVEHDAATGTTRARPLDTAVGADLIASLGLLGRAELAVHLPVALVYEGDGLVAGGRLLSPSGGLGDVRLVPKGLLWRSGGPRALTVAAAAPITFPTGDGAALRGADRVTVEPRLLLGAAAARWQLHLNAGYRVRGDPPAGVVGGDEVTFGASLTGAVLSRRPDLLEAHLEIVGGVLTSGSAPAAVKTPLAALAGVIWRPHGDWALHAGAGPGLTRGLGEPDVRVVVGARWSPRRAVGGAAGPDRDGDGVPDARDRCPDAAEDRDGFEDSDGCPEPDNDRDRVPDATDECPGVAEEKGGDGDGCPDRARVALKDGALRVFGKIQFETGSAVLKRSSEAFLDEIAAVLRDSPRVRRLRIEGHTDDVGDEAKNQRLSAARAESVERALVERGVDPARLETRGHGESRPIAPNDTPAGRATNRRVEFNVVE